MTQDWNYIPLFKSTAVSMNELSDEDFGRIVRALVNDVETRERPDGFSDVLYMMYKIMADDALRVYELRNKKREQSAKRGRSGRASRSPSPQPKKSYQSDDIDPDEALRLALARSFGEEDNSDL